MDNECPICFNELSSKLSINTPCSHIICLECFINLKNMECPICRTSFNKNNFTKSKFKSIALKYKSEFKINSQDFPPL